MARRMRGSHIEAVAVTPLPCTPTNRITMQEIAREIVATHCIDRVAACDTRGKVVVTASCPTAGAAKSFEKRVETWGKKLKR